jgi:hypothetical protein
MPLLALPNEVILEILRLLDYKALRSVKQQDRFLRSLVPDELMCEALYNAETNDKAMIDKAKSHEAIFARHDALPCYGCLQVKKTGEFYQIFDLSRFRLGEIGRRQRRCIDCDRLGRKFLDLVHREKAAFDLRWTTFLVYKEICPSWSVKIS